MKLLGPFGLLLIVIGIFLFAQRGKVLHDTSLRLKKLKEHNAELNHIKYGLLNLSLWKNEVSDILAEQIDKFELSEQARSDIRSYIMKYLHEFYQKQIVQGELIDQFLGIADDGKKEFEVFGMKIKVPIKELLQKEIAASVDKMDIDATLSTMADQMMVELKRNEPLIKEAIQKQLSGLLVKDNSSAGGLNISGFEKKYNCQGLIACNQLISKEIEDLEAIELTAKNQLALYSLIPFFLLMILGFFGNHHLYQWVVIPGLTILSLLFLFLGLTLPMIDLYAGLENVKINLMGKNVDFGEQVLFFQSKSIFEVVNLLLEGRHWDSKLVGILILVFSIVFPIIKTISTFLMSYISKMRQSKLIQNLALVLSKWSMADVFVVGLFMAYIGFNSIVRSQLIDLNQSKEAFDIVTENKTILRPGAIFFTGFVLISMCMSTMISLKLKKESTKA